MNKNENEKNEINNININIKLDSNKNTETEVLHEIIIAHAKSGLENTFASFLYYDIPYLVFSTKDKSIISYNLKDLSVGIEIKNAHESSIKKIRDYQKNNNIIYILSICSSKNNVKIWILKIGSVFLI
jgi:hypothetical protein